MKQVLFFVYAFILCLHVQAQDTNDSIQQYKQTIARADYYHRKVEGLVNVYPDSAHLYLDSVVLLFRGINDTWNVYATDHVNRAKILVKQHKLSKAILLLEEYMEYTRKNNIPEDAFVYIETGNIYYQLNLLDIARNYYIKALRCRYHDRFVYPVCLNNLGMIMQKKGYYQQAALNFLRTYYFRQLLQPADKINPLYSLRLLVENRNLAGYPNQALHYANMAGEVYEHESELYKGNNYGYADLLLEKMNAFVALGQKDSALLMYSKVHALLKNMSKAMGGIQLELRAAEIWLQKNHIPQTLQCLKELDNRRQNEFSLTDRIRYGEIKKAILLKQHNEQAALLWKLEVLQLKDSLTKLNAIDEILDFNTHILESQSKLVQTQQEEKLKQGEQILQQETNNRKGVTFILFLIVLVAIITYYFYRQAVKDRKLISTQNREKELLIREIHHRVKNNLTVITGILDLQERGLKDDAQKAVFRDAKSRVNSMALVHKNLYEQENLAEVNTQQYFENLCRTISSLYNQKGKKISWVVNCHHTVLNTDSLVPLALITNELLTNSYKYAFVNEGEINISLHKDSNYIFEYKDNGIGITQAANPKGLGTQLIAGLSKQLNGSCEQIETNKGVYYQIKFSGISTFS